MIRGTTPTHTFTLPFDVSEIKEIDVCYAQQGTIVLQKTFADCDAEGNKITIVLSQEETLEFRDNAGVQIQLRVLTKNNKALASRITTKYVKDVLYDGVLE